MTSVREWSETKRIEVATAHAMGLKATMIEVATGVPAQTIRHWRMQDWFKDLVSEMQREEDIEVDAKFTKILNRALDSVVDRLENGDFMYDPKKQRFVRRPIYIKDAARVADLVFDKRNLLRGKPTTITAKQEQLTDRLSKIALEFERFVNAKEVKGEVIPYRQELVQAAAVAVAAIQTYDSGDTLGSPEQVLKEIEAERLRQETIVFKKGEAILDSQNQERVQGQIGIREESVIQQSESGASQEATPAG